MGLNFMDKYIDKYFKTLLFTFLLIIGIFVYSPEINGEFIFDDVQYVENNPVYNNLDTFLSSKRQMIQRPLYWFSFFVEKRLWGNNPLGYKVVNVLFHVLASFIFFFFIRRLLKVKYKLMEEDEKNDFSNINFLFPFFGSLLFLVSPIVIEGISYISGRNNGIGGMFFILAAYLFLIMLDVKKNKTKIFLGFLTFFAFVCSFLFKEIYIVFPIFCIFLYLNIEKITKKRLFLLVGALFFFGLILSFATYKSEIQPFPRIKVALKSNIEKINQQALATNIYAIGYSMHLATFPDKLNIDHDLPVIDNFLDHRVIAILLFVIAMFIVFWIFRKKLPLSFFSYISYLLLMLPSNSFILRGSSFVKDPISERNLYVPAFFYTIILLEIIWVACKKDIKKFKIVTLIFVFIFGIRTFVRNMDFKSNVTLWKASVKYSPKRARPNFNYAAALKDVGKVNEAIPFAKKAFELNPRDNTLGLLSSLYKLSGDNSKYEKFLMDSIKQKEFQKAEIYHQLGELYSSQGKYEDAIENFILSYKKKPKFILPRLSLTYIYIDQNKLNLAKKQLKFMQHLVDKQVGRYYEGVLIDNVVSARVSFAWALYYFAKKNDAKGLEFCEKSFNLNNNFTEPFLKLAEYYYLKQEDKKSWDYFYKASKTPDYSKYKKQIAPMIEVLQKSLENR